jgi:predicted transcriptional regulator
MAKYKKMTPAEYAKARGITLQAVTKAIREGHTLPHVKKVEKFGRFYLLTVEPFEQWQ